ncbi:hypothetical protein Tco_1102401 [Tanacetum coccineum]
MPLDSHLDITSDHKPGFAGNTSITPDSVHVDPVLWSDVISRWESITINRLNSQTWSDNKAKLAFVKNLLGESEELMWQQWRTAYPGAYSALETIADDPQNITS